MKLRRIHTFIIISILMASCTGWNWEPVESDTDPVLNVFGIISLDQEIPPFVYVTRTLTLQDSVEMILRYDTIYYSPDYYDIYPVYNSNFIISDAIVTISDGTSEYAMSPVRLQNGGYPSGTDDKDYQPILPFWFDGESAIIYFDTSGYFIPLPETRYDLSVSVNGFKTLIGSCTTPPLPQITNSEQLPDTLSSGTGYTIRWQPFGSSINGIVQYQNGDWGENVRRIIEGGDSVFVFIPELQNNYYSESPDQTFILTVRAMDANYYDYFVKGNTDEFFSFVLGASQHALAYGVENGYGLFGAFSQFTMTRRLVSN